MLPGLQSLQSRLAALDKGPQHQAVPPTPYHPSHGPLSPLTISDQSGGLIRQVSVLGMCVFVGVSLATAGPLAIIYQHARNGLAFASLFNAQHAFKPAY